MRRRCNGGDVESNLKHKDDLDHPRLLGSNMGILGGDMGQSRLQCGYFRPPPAHHLPLEFGYLLCQRCDMSQGRYGIGGSHLTMTSISHAPIHLPWPITKSVVEGVRHDTKLRILEVGHLLDRAEAGKPPPQQ